MLNYYSGQLKRGIYRCALNPVRLERIALFYAISTPSAIVFCNKYNVPCLAYYAVWYK